MPRKSLKEIERAWFEKSMGVVDRVYTNNQVKRGYFEGRVTTEHSEPTTLLLEILWLQKEIGATAEGNSWADLWRQLLKKKNFPVSDNVDENRRTFYANTTS